MSPNLRQQPENRSSVLLSQEENEQIRALLGYKCISIATAVVQLFHTNQPDHSYWNKQEVGVLCFVKDYAKKNYFFRLYCLRRSGKVWEHEVYKNMEYKCAKSFFHSFEGEKCIYAFNFASYTEAEEVKHVVVEKLEEMKLRAARKKPEAKTTRILAPIQNSSKNNSQNKKHRKKLTKEDIGKPTEFRHITAVRFDCVKGLDVNTSDEMYREIFKRAGVKDEMLQHSEQRDFLYDFVDSCMSSKPEASISHAPTRSAPRPPPPQTRTPPPPPVRKIQTSKPSQQKVLGNLQPPNFDPPPPPPPPRPLSLSIPNSNTAVPPPPPPPLPALAIQTDSVQNSANTSPAPDMRSALLENIRQGATLKPVSSQPQSSEPDRDDMLKQIKEGISLKSVADRELQSPVSSINEVNDIAMALKKVLQSRSIAIRSDDDTSSENSTDDEWDC